MDDSLYTHIVIETEREIGNKFQRKSCMHVYWRYNLLDKQQSWNIQSETIVAFGIHTLFIQKPFYTGWFFDSPTYF